MSLLTSHFLFFKKEIVSYEITKKYASQQTIKLKYIPDKLVISIFFDYYLNGI